MTTIVRTARPAGLPDLASMLSRAFIDDPMLVWPLGPVDDIGTRIAETFLHLDTGLVETGMLWEAGGGAGAALWIPPDGLHRFAEIEQASRPAIHALTGDGGARYDGMWDWIESMLPAEPMWFLEHVGVEPARQGCGIGAALIELGLAKARADGVAAFLETGKIANVAYYERLGFRLVAEGDAPGDGPHIWFMHCEPA